MVARPGQCGGALAAKRVRTTWRIITWAAARVRFALAVARRRARSAENGLDLARCATCMFFFGVFVFLAIACVCMWRRTLVVGGGNRLGDARRAPTYAVRKLRACVCECVCAYAPAPLCRVPVCTTRLAFAGSNSAGRGTCCLARVCVRAFVFGFVLMQFLFFFFRLLLICYCFNSVGGEGGGGWFESSSCCVPSNERVCVCVRVLRVPRGCCLVPCTSSLWFECRPYT